MRYLILVLVFAVGCDRSPSYVKPRKDADVTPSASAASESLRQSMSYSDCGMITSVCNDCDKEWGIEVEYKTCKGCGWMNCFYGDTEARAFRCKKCGTDVRSIRCHKCNKELTKLKQKKVMEHDQKQDPNWTPSKK